MAKDKQVVYDVFIELFYILGINPYEFFLASGNNVRGWWPDLPERKNPKVDPEELALLIWENYHV